MQQIRNRSFKFLKPIPLVLVSVLFLFNIFSNKTTEAENKLTSSLSKNSFPFSGLNLLSLPSPKKRIQAVTEKKPHNISLSENTKKSQAEKAVKKNKKLSARPKKTKNRKMVKNTKSNTKKKTAEASAESKKRKPANIAEDCFVSSEDIFTKAFLKAGYNCDNLKEVLGCKNEDSPCPEIHCVSSYEIKRNSCENGMLTQFYCDPAKDDMISSREIKCPEGCDPSGFFCTPPKN